ncbi:hypothetical protein QUF58_04010 [Anaerolineales bacterium HSG24]|nr:hypothetical protein [Anaerolineales bacterium HSG24]
MLGNEKKRELDPTVDVLRQSVKNLECLPDNEAEYERKQLKELLEFFETGIEVYEELESQTPNSILKLLGQTLKLKKRVGI